MQKRRLDAIGILAAVVVTAGTMAVRHFQRSALLAQCHTSARQVGMATLNFVETWKCLPSLQPEIQGSEPRRWRTMLFNYVDASRALTLEELKARPAAIFHLADPSAQQTNIYAITGEGAAYSPEFECEFDTIPGHTLLYVAGRPSAEPWYEAGDVSLEMLRESSGTARQVLGEACEGLTFLVFANGEACAVDSSIPAELLARQADARDAKNQAIRPELAARVREFP